MTRKHFQAIADQFKDQLGILDANKDVYSEDAYQAARSMVYVSAQRMADVCRNENSNFDRFRFLAACGFEG